MIKRLIDLVDLVDSIQSLNQLYEIEEREKWRPGTTCVIGDSILSNLDEKRLGRNSMVKVRYHTGGTVGDMYHHVKPILRCPTYIILHCGTNNATYQSAQIVLNNILNLKHFIEVNLPSCTVIISTAES